MQNLARRLSLSALAERIGVSYQQVQKHERGVNHVGASRPCPHRRRARPAGRGPVRRRRNRRNGDASLDAGPDREKDAMRLIQAFARLKDGELRWLIVGLVENVAEAL